MYYELFNQDNMDYLLKGLFRCNVLVKHMNIILGLKLIILRQFCILYFLHYDYANLSHSSIERQCLTIEKNIRKT